MLTANYSEFRGGLKKISWYEQHNETLIVERAKGKGSVVMSLEEYNSLMETVHLLSSKANAERLYESIQQIKDGDSVSKNLIEDKWELFFLKMFGKIIRLGCKTIHFEKDQ